MRADREERGSARSARRPESTTMMRRLAFSSLLFVGVGLATGAPMRPEKSTATTEVIELLSAIDFLPGTGQLNQAMNSDLTVLTELANDEESDPGVRLRAYRSLGDYDQPASHAALVTAIERYRGMTSGTQLLYLIASTEGLGQIGTPEEVDLIGPLLYSSSRDLKVAAARALGQIGDPVACKLLRDRRDDHDLEDEGQVTAAIDAAKDACP